MANTDVSFLYIRGSDEAVVPALSPMCIKRWYNKEITAKTRQKAKQREVKFWSKGKEKKTYIGHFIPVEIQCASQRNNIIGRRKVTHIIHIIIIFFYHLGNTQQAAKQNTDIQYHRLEKLIQWMFQQTVAYFNILQILSINSFYLESCFWPPDEK